MKLYMEKLYRYDRHLEPLSVCIPVKKGQLKSADKVKVTDKDIILPSQTKVTSRYDDGSVRFLYTRFLGNLPGNATKEFEIIFDKEMDNIAQINEFTPISLIKEEKRIQVDTGKVAFCVEDYSDSVFTKLVYGNKIYTADDFVGPVLKDKHGETYNLAIDEWKVCEAGDVCVILEACGHNEKSDFGCEDSNHYRFELRITAYAGKAYLDISYRIFNTSEKELDIKELTFAIKADADSKLDSKLTDMKALLGQGGLDSTGCGDMKVRLDKEAGPVYRTRGIGDLEKIEELTPVNNIRTTAGASNYKTDFYIGRDGHEVNRIACAEDLLMEGNEHMPEVLYGTFFADRTDENGGICATIFQAQQNYPKAVKADKSGIYVMLVPENVSSVIMQPGMAREQRFMLYFHDSDETITEIDNRSLIYQMPDRPIVSPEDCKNSGAFDNVFANKINGRVEITLIGKADAHQRCYGMLNWGDSIDQNYTKQGRGGGAPVWINNEYDYPHACAMMYVRTGIRRYLDFSLVHASHWMDVDICHYSSDPLRVGGMIEHTKGHVMDGVMVPSHEWVEGLIDYYHFTGDERGLKAAIGVGENVLALLDTPTYQTTGESNARETGWALRTLTALYVETGDEKWKEKCNWIVGHFREWLDEYGCFVAPYTDNTLVRVGFMISVAVGSLMRYYRVEPSASLKELIMAAVDDIVDNCRMDCGLFYYKELPSLSRLGNNNLLLEAMATGYELTGDKKYLEAGLPTFLRATSEPPKYVGGDKKIIGDALCMGGDSTKNFAQSFYPLAYYYKCIDEAGLEGALKYLY